MATSTPRATMKKTAKSRKDYADNTRKTRTDRRRAFLEVVAHRMGFDCWSTIETQLIANLEIGKTDVDIQNGLVALLRSYADGVIPGGYDRAPDDVAAVIAQYPKNGRPKAGQATPRRAPITWETVRADLGISHIRFIPNRISKKIPYRSYKAIAVLPNGTELGATANEISLACGHEFFQNETHNISAAILSKWLAREISDEEAADPSAFPFGGSQDKRSSTCEHPRVTTRIRMVSRQTLYEPAEYASKTTCDECGEELDSAPDGAEEKEVEWEDDFEE